jgi:hypothetical protein
MTKKVFIDLIERLNDQYDKYLDEYNSPNCSDHRKREIEVETKGLRWYVDSLQLKHMTLNDQLKKLYV